MERTIRFNSEMFAALREGRKTQTRRPVQPQPKHANGIIPWTSLRYFEKSGYAIECGPDYPDDESDERHCPYGVAGDILHAREVMTMPEAIRLDTKGDTTTIDIFRLAITAVRVEMVQSIITADIDAEGVDNGKSNKTMGYRHDNMQRMAWRNLWESLYRKGGDGPYRWDLNPWVWVVEFKVI